MKKRINKKKFLLIMCAFIFSLAIYGGNHVYAGSDNDAEMTEEERKGYEDTKEHSKYLPLIDPSSKIDESYFKKYPSNGAKKDTNIPSYYGVKDKPNNLVSSVKNQDRTGTCWCFSMMECLQDSAKVLEIANNPGFTGEFDFSEYANAYFMYYHPEDKLNLISGDIVDSYYEPGTLDYYCIGGTELWGARAVATGIGAKSEIVAKFDDLVSNVRSDKVSKLPDSLCYRDADYTLKKLEVYNLKDSNARNAIKAMIMSHGAGQIGYQHNNDAFDYSTYGYYYDTDKITSDSSGHAVCIVGWDDDYSVDNFKYAPPEKGAWLIKNSWGEDWGLDGYFWMSYYEPSLTEIYFYDAEKADSYDNIYQYDGTVTDETISGYKTGANIYTAQQNETINAVSFYTIYDGTKCDVYIYKINDPNNPSSGECVYSSTGITINHMGYTKLDLDSNENLKMNAGDKFSVVVKQTVNDASSPMYVDKDQLSLLNIDSEANKGESFVSEEASGWKDWIDISEGGSNLCIKAFTKVDDSALVGDIELDKDVYTVKLFEFENADVKIAGSSILKNSVLSFSTDKENIAYVDEMGRIYGRNIGETTLTVKRGDKTDTATVKVVANDGDSIKLTKNDGYATTDNPLKVNLGEEVGVDYKVYPYRYKFDVHYTVEALDNNIDIEKAYTYYRSRFYFHKTGKYKITFTVDGKGDATSSKVDFYIDATPDVTICNSAEVIKAEPYENRKTKIYKYDTGRNHNLINLDADIEEDFDYLLVFASDESIENYQVIYDHNRDFLNSVDFSSAGDYDITKDTDYTSGAILDATVLTGSYDDYSFRIDHRYLYFVISSDLFMDGSFMVKSIDDYKAVTDFAMKSEDMDDIVKVGKIGSYDLTISPTDDDVFKEMIVCESADDSIAVASYDVKNNKIKIEGKKAGETKVYIHPDDVDPENESTIIKTSKDAVGEYVTATISGTGPGEALCISVTVTEDSVDPVDPDVPATFTFADGTPTSFVRNSETLLTFNDDKWSEFDISFESTKPTVAYVNNSGRLIAVSSGNAIITAVADTGQGDQNPKATLEVTVSAPADYTVSNLQTVHNYVPGMKETYAYQAPDGTECINIYFDTRSSIAEGDTITIDYGDNSVIVDDFSRAYSVYSDKFNINFISEGTPVYDDAYAYAGKNYGFRVKRVECGKAAKSISLKNNTIDLKFDTLADRYGKIEVVKDPVDAIDIIYYKTEDGKIATVDDKGYLTATNDGTTSFTAYISKPGSEAIEAIGTVSIAEIPLNSVLLYDGDDNPIVGDSTAITLRPHEGYDFKYIKDPWNASKRIGVSFDTSALICWQSVGDAYTYITIEAGDNPGTYTFDITAGKTLSAEGVKAHTFIVTVVGDEHVTPIDPGKTEPAKKTDTSGSGSGQSDNTSKSDSSKSKYSNEWVDGKWYNQDGTQTYTGTISWRQNSKGWWAEDTKGWYPAKTWQKINGVWYYFDEEGYMAANEWIDGYWLDKDGVWRYKYVGSWRLNSKGWWFEDTNKWYAYSGWQKINGKYYYFGDDGYMYKNRYIGEFWVGDDGAYVESE